MIKVKKYEVKIKSNDDEIAPELLCAIMAVLETLYINGEKEIIDELIKPEVRKMLDCNSLEDLRKYRDEEEM